MARLKTRARTLFTLVCFLLQFAATPAPAADGAAFDLTGPALGVAVTHGGVTLPLSQVPNLAAGDGLRIEARLPADQGARYLMVLAFLRGATNPPPKSWLVRARTWKPKEAIIETAVPEGAQQAVVFLAPETGGAFDAIAAAVRQRPGAFVRASQDLNQAMLDRTRLAAFLASIRGRSAEQVAKISPVLAQSLAVKLDPACLEQRQDPQGACLTQGQSAAVLADGQTSSIAQTLADAPANIALQLSATPQAGFGYYSAYVGVFRDLARLLGAFQSAQLQFIPALNVQQRSETALLLNTVPSFRKPQSVLVAVLPPVSPPALPPLERADAKLALCLAQPGLVLPVRGAPLVFSTDYARNVRLRVLTKAGATELPVRSDPAQGGFVLAESSLPMTVNGGGEGTLHGLWGFTPFEGPSFRLNTAADGNWSADDATLVIGRDTPLTLSGGAAPCVEEVRMERGSLERMVPFERTADGRLALKVPLTDVKPGPVALAIRSYGVADPFRITVRAYAEASRLDAFSLHEGDARAVLTGARLDQVASVDVSGTTFRPGALTRSGSSDRLELLTDSASLRAGQSVSARATLVDGRTLRLPVTIARPRPGAKLLDVTAEPLRARSVPLTLSGMGNVPQDARVTFSLRAVPGTKFAEDDGVEVRVAGASPVRLLLRLQDEGVAIATLEPGALGEAAHGALEYRLVQGDAAGDWSALGTLVRVPDLEGVDCDIRSCRLHGTGLFLLRSVGGVALPDGFTGSSIAFPRQGGSVTLVLRDTADVRGIIALPAAK